MYKRQVTGLGTKLSTLIIALAGGKLILILLFTAVAAIILGMGLPTVAAYSILVTLIVPTLTKLDILPIAAHMFIFYFGIISNVTPPVALAAFAAAGLSGGSVLWTGVKATRLALAGFIIPFVMIYAPEILMIGEPVEIAIVSITALIGVYALATATVGYYFTNCTVPERIINAVAGIMLVVPDTMISLIGLVIFVVSTVFNRKQARSKKVKAA